MRGQVIIRTDEEGRLVQVYVSGKVEVIHVEDQPVERSWLQRGVTKFNGGPDDNRPIVVRKPTPTMEQLVNFMFEARKASRRDA
jgi:hypothetical protein